MEPPVKPDESDCCNSGCNPCILDVYEEQLRNFQKKIQGALKRTKNCFSPTSFTIFKLVNVEKHSKDCNLYTFEYVRPQKFANTSEDQKDVGVLYEPGQYFVLKDNQPGNQFTVLVKLYENGRMSRFFQRLTIDCETSWRGPYGDFHVNYKEKNILFIAQGTGITPFYTIICDILNNEDCFTFLRLFFCCNVKNILLRDELYKLMQYWNFKYELFISLCGDDIIEAKYNEIVHFYKLDAKNIEYYLKETMGSVKTLICGSEHFCKNIRNMLVQCGVENEDIIVF